MTIQFLSQVTVKAFAHNRKRYGKLPEGWVQIAARHANYRKVDTVPNPEPDTVYHVIGRKMLMQGYSDYIGEEGYVFVEKGRVYAYVVANKLGKSFVVLEADMQEV